MFTRRHYIAIARVVAATRSDRELLPDDGGAPVYIMKQEIIERLIALFRLDNPRFQEQTFRDVAEETRQS